LALCIGFVHIVVLLTLGPNLPVLSHDQKFRLVALMSAHVPHAALLGIRVHSVVGDELTLTLPFQDTLIGDAEAGTLHGGALTVLLDQTLGLATVCSNLCEPAVTPTLDLRIDHLRVPPPGMDVYATAKVYRSPPKVPFVEGVA